MPRKAVKGQNIQAQGKALCLKWGTHFKPCKGEILPWVSLYNKKGCSRNCNLVSYTAANLLLFLQTAPN